MLLHQHSSTAEYKAAFDRLMEARTRLEAVQDVDAKLVEGADREFQEARKSFIAECAAASNGSPEQP